MQLLKQVSNEMSIFLTSWKSIPNSDQFGGKVRISDHFQKIRPKSQHCYCYPGQNKSCKLASSLLDDGSPNLIWWMNLHEWQSHQLLILSSKLGSDWLWYFLTTLKFLDGLGDLILLARPFKKIFSPERIYHQEGRPFDPKIFEESS